jgi:hypothetical protein
VAATKGPSASSDLGVIGGGRWLLAPRAQQPCRSQAKRS